MRLEIPSNVMPPKIQKRLQFLGRLLQLIISLTVVIAIVVDYGFVLDTPEKNAINTVYHFAWLIYLLSFITFFIFPERKLPRKTLIMNIILGILFLLTTLPTIFPITDETHSLYKVWKIFDHHIFLILLIGIFSVLNIAKGVVRFINKKTNPALLMVVCFAVIIIFGALLLMVPRSTLPHIRLPIIDALFISTSAVCVTGLTPLEVAHTFTWEGQLIIAFLIQIGGLGVMTLTSVFALFFMGQTGIYGQMALRDMVGTETFNSLISTLLYIVGFSFIMELIGACVIWASIHDTMGMTLQEEIFFSIFHAISSFCNAGFSTLPGNLGNETIIQGHNGFYLIISLLIILGGIGFPILSNLHKTISYYWKRFLQRFSRTKKTIPRLTHLASLNSKIVLSTTLFLIVIGTVLTAIAEWNGAFVYMNVGEKLTHSFFNAVSPRTAGFNSVSLTEFSFFTIFLYMILMWIGGGTQSTAGGIKVSTLAVLWFNFKSVVLARSDVRIFNREIEHISIRRATAVAFGSIITILLFFITLTAFEPQIAPLSLLFETISAFSTVGHSLNVTPLLGNDSKFLLSLLMFIGRVGMITVLMSFTRQTSSPKNRLPKESIIIN